MSRLAIPFSLSILLASAVATAQHPETDKDEVESSYSFSQLAPTSEMWFYDQELRRHNDPQVAVRQKAEFRANQRQRRIETMKWFGMSNSRPYANAMPIYGYYSPMWTGGGWHPFQWNGGTRHGVVYVGRRGTYGLW